ncbi:hypothetical protein [Phocaeicola sp.]
MKHTDFFAQTRAIKIQEYKELYAAVEAHGGTYEWNLSEGNYPTIAVNVDSIYPNPMDMNIYKVSIQDGILQIYGEDKEYGNNIPFKLKDVFAGHLSSIIDYIPAAGDVDEVTCLQESFPIAHIRRDEISSWGYDVSNIPDNTMAELARRMGNAYCENGYWEDLRTIAGNLDIPLIVNAWFNDMEFKEMERVTGFRQDDFSPDEGYQDFVDVCEDWWKRKTDTQKQSIYHERYY